MSAQVLDLVAERQVIAWYEMQRAVGALPWSMLCDKARKAWREKWDAEPKYLTSSFSFSKDGAS